jgi:hypothetical protein
MQFEMEISRQLIEGKSQWNLRSSGMLRSVDWYLVTDAQEYFFDFLTLEDGTDRLSRNVGNHQSTLRNIT